MSFSDCLIKRVDEPTFPEMILVMYHNDMIPFWSETKCVDSTFVRFMDRINESVLQNMYKIYESKKENSKFNATFMYYYNNRMKRSNFIKLIKELTGDDIKEPYTSLMDVCLHSDKPKFCDIVYHSFIYGLKDWNSDTVSEFLKKIGFKLANKLVKYAKSIDLTDFINKRFVDELVSNHIVVESVETVEVKQFLVIKNITIKKLNDLVRLTKYQEFPQYVIDCMCHGLEDWKVSDENEEKLADFLMEIGKSKLGEIIVFLVYQMKDPYYSSILKVRPNSTRLSYIYNLIRSADPFEFCIIKPSENPEKRIFLILDTKEVNKINDLIAYIKTPFFTEKCVDVLLNELDDRCNSKCDYDAFIKFLDTIGCVETYNIMNLLRKKLHNPSYRSILMTYSKNQIQLLIHEINMYNPFQLRLSNGKITKNQILYDPKNDVIDIEKEYVKKDNLILYGCVINTLSDLAKCKDNKDFIINAVDALFCGLDDWNPKNVNLTSFDNFRNSLNDTQLKDMQELLMKKLEQPDYKSVFITPSRESIQFLIDKLSKSKINATTKENSGMVTFQFDNKSFTESDIKAIIEENIKLKETIEIIKKSMSELLNPK